MHYQGRNLDAQVEGVDTEPRPRPGRDTTWVGAGMGYVDHVVGMGYVRPSTRDYAPFEPDRPLAVPRERLVRAAWVALALGVVSVCGSPVVFLNNMTAMLGIVGAGIAAFALFGNRRLIAAGALALCVAGVVATVMFQRHWGDQLDRVTHGAAPAGWCRAASCAPPSVDQFCTPRLC